MKLTPARRNDLIMVALALAVIVADQLTKHWIVQYFQTPGLRPPIRIFGPLLQLEYTQNTGVAFSLLQGQAILFVFVVVALCVIGWLYWRMRDTGSLAIKLTFGLILGGAAGNLIDRLQHAYVVDFIHFQIPSIFDFAVFNVADSAISVGVVALAFLLWRGLPESASTVTVSRPAGSDAANAASATGASDIAALGEGATPRPPTTPRVRNPHARTK